MRRIKKELDVDFIGNQEPLTKSEEKQLSDYFKKSKHIKTKRKTKNKETAE